MMASREQCSPESFKKFLTYAPPLKELTEHVDLGTNWYRVGVMLGLKGRQLNSIESDCTIKMFDLWLAANPDASRSKILKVLKNPAVRENTVAFMYEKSLKKYCK